MGMDRAADAHRVTLTRLESERRDIVATVHRMESSLGTRLPQDRRTVILEQLRRCTERLRLVNAAIKSGRRAGNLLLLNGMDRPRTERELVAALYRLYADAVPQREQSERERAILRTARDYVASGIISSGWR